jgi:hypothetical protein
MAFPEIAGNEPLTIARVLWFSPDGTSWSNLDVSGLFGTFGALKVAVTDDRVVLTFGANQPEDLERITEPTWWIGTPPWNQPPPTSTKVAYIAPCCRTQRPARSPTTDNPGSSAITWK